MPKPQSSSTILGIDPGASGGVAVLYDGVAEAIKMPRTREGICAIIEDYAPNAVFLEKVGGYRKGNPTPGSMMFNFGRGVGWWEMALTALGFPFEEIPPATWQKALEISFRNSQAGESKEQFKRRLLSRAREEFPELKVTHYTADALLIALYGKRKLEKTLSPQKSLF